MGPLKMPTHTQTYSADSGIPEQAAQWISRLECATEQDRAAFINWLRASPQHVKEFLLLSAMDKELDDLDLRDLDVDALLARQSENVIPLHEMRHELRPASAVNSHASTAPLVRRSLSGGGRLIAGVAATLLIGIGAWWMTAGPGSWQSYATAIGEQRAFELEDGSTIEMSPLSSVSVRMSRELREVRLQSGEALFKVEHDAARPFRVDSDSTVVKVLGTWFAVNRRTGSVTVSVLKGHVAVDDRVLVAGEAVKIMSSGTILDRSVTPEPSSAGLPRRSLVFSGDTLGEIAEDFNRYNRSPQITIEGDALRARQFSGVFDAQDPDSLVDSLARDERIEIVRRDGTIVIRQK